MRKLTPLFVPAAGVLVTGIAVAAPSTRLPLSLGKGHYSLICNLTGHYSNGQFVDFYVRHP